MNCQKEIFKIAKEAQYYVLYVYGKEFVKSKNLNDVIIEQTRICIL